jgi:hypothetical protein
MLLNYPEWPLNGQAVCLKEIDWATRSRKRRRCRSPKIDPQSPDNMLGEDENA